MFLVVPCDKHFQILFQGTPAPNLPRAPLLQVLPQGEVLPPAPGDLQRGGHHRPPPGGAGDRCGQGLPHAQVRPSHSAQNNKRV